MSENNSPKQEDDLLRLAKSVLAEGYASPNARALAQTIVDAKENVPSNAPSPAPASASEPTQSYAEDMWNIISSLQLLKEEAMDDTQHDTKVEATLKDKVDNRLRWIEYYASHCDMTDAMVIAALRTLADTIRVLLDPNQPQVNLPPYYIPY